MEGEKTKYEEMYDVARIASILHNDLIDKWLTKYKVGEGYKDGQDTFKLNRSISVTAITGSDGELERVVVRMLKYGQYVDMGVGRGMKTGTKQQLKAEYKLKRLDNGQLHSHKFRKPKPGYSKTMAHTSLRLGEFLSKRYGVLTIAMINEALPAVVDMGAM